MKTHTPNTTRGVITFVEMLCGLAVVLIVGVVCLPMFARPTNCSGRIKCVNNLKQVGLSFRIFANDNNDHYPTQLADGKGGAKESVECGDLFRVFLVMSNELSVPKTVICPADTRLAATNWNAFGNTNTSYFVGLDAAYTTPNMLLAGDRNLALKGKPLIGQADLRTNSPLTWTAEIHKQGGNIVLADSSVQQVTIGLLRQQLAISGDASNRVLFPQ